MNQIKTRFTADALTVDVDVLAVGQHVAGASAIGNYMVSVFACEAFACVRAE
jgi:hypothetical protein